jgi:hypothetical protein
LEAEAVWQNQLDLRRKSRPQFEAVLRQWEAMLRRPVDARPPSVQRDAFLRATLLVPAWRDAVLVMAAAGRAAALAGAEEFGIFDDGEVPGPLEPAAEEAGSGTATSGPRAPGAPSFALQAGYVQDALGPGLPVSGDLAGTACYGDVLMGQAPPVPQWGTMDSLDLALEQVAVPGGASAAAALTLRGWIAWCRGRGSFAAAHFGEALEIEPGYRLAELLLELVRRGTLCGWAARKDAAWQKFRPDAA